MAKASTPKRPTRDEFELEELGNQLVEAKEDGDMRVLTVWGETDKVSGRITQLDSRTRLVHVENDDVTRKVPFLRYYENQLRIIDRTRLRIKQRRVLLIICFSRLAPALL